MVIWSQPARNDLKHIHDFIAQDSRFYAKKVVAAIKEKTDTLSAFPQIGKIVPEINDSHVRELSIYSYRILYQINRETVYILAVVHKRRDFEL